MHLIQYVMQVLAFGCGAIAASTTSYLDVAPHDRGRDLSADRSNALPRVLFSMTTTLHIPGKHRFVEEALETLTMYHPDSALVIGRWLLINEYSENNSNETSLILRHLKGRFPFLHIIQKTSHDQGQANSLNIILREVRSSTFSYWLHVEESWHTVRPFLHQSVAFMDNHRYIHQLQLYHAGYYTSHTHTRITEDIEVITLDSYIDLSDVNPRDWRMYSLKWPSYSLRPSLTRVDFIKDHPNLAFNANPDWFPVIFEFDFALKWQHSGGSMCAVMRDAIVRQEGHKSTYVLP